MQTFISETVQDILKKTTTFDNVVFVLPSQRAGVFVKQTLKDQISTGFLPEIINIEQFVERVSEIKKVDAVQLLFHFYTIYKSHEVTPDTFDRFSTWAFTVLQDFNEIDQHLVNTREIFVYLRDINRLRKWSVKGSFEETELMKDHYAFTEKLNEYYNAFYEFLVENKIGYQGVLYREATKKIDEYIAKHPKKKIFFIGFNALNASEEFLFQKLLYEEKAEVYWDIDSTFLNNNHQAGNFIRRYKKQWKFYEKNDLKTIGDWFSKPKNIELVGASKNISQIKYAGEVLAKLPNYNNTALVLADETLLPITLNSLPENVDAINITMGYPLKDIPTTSLLFSIFQLFISQEKLQKSAQNVFYYKDVIRFIKEPLIYQLLSTETEFLSDIISEQISKENNTFVSQEYMISFLKNTSEETQKIITSIFEKFMSIHEFLQRIINLINALKENVSGLEKEYLFRFYTAFTQLQNLHSEFNYFTDLKTLHQFFRKLISSESLSFQGEPLQGLQLMGMLETRVLDFENVILTSVNEGVLPGNTQPSSFIPFDVKVQFGLPTYREKDAIFSYHFFRLIQRAKNVILIYNTESDTFGGGEKSRFVTQLELIRDGIVSKIVSPKVVTEKSELKEITKSEQALEKLKELAEKGISPSALTNYLYNPIAFYKQKVLKIREFEEVEEEVAYNTLGTVVHDTLEELYKPFVGKFLLVNDVVEMQKKVKILVEKYFKEHFKKGDITTGKNRLIFEVAIRFVENFLQQERTLLKDKKNQLKIIGTEKNYEAKIEVDGIDFPIKIHGQVDRVDVLNGVTRVIDYKTGMVKSTDLKITDFEQIRDYKFSKAIQVLLYAFMYTQTEEVDASKPIQAGIYSFKNLKNGFLQLNFSEKRGGQDNEVTEERIQEFMQEVKVLVQEIFNPAIGFIEPADLPY
ncbi:PD-(D/E)XK nuclease superfamily protein [Tenacibaculum adriaticum]|uniref:PD-(D/E)XK nuclease superfamily protein n=1 Tax=Tenacibaculum adriaticum TaxID=413713 RepID=A0A5S5DV12_9FLAO|nr:PD-(D/E)XK nuclease family protein [Tenacibaculum adriaticum]TYP99685.1 PD-(D/E)XK nuclease superfamily protein [Tenacibaculum adriaticum]